MASQGDQNRIMQILQVEQASWERQLKKSVSIITWKLDGAILIPNREWCLSQSFPSLFLNLCCTEILLGTDFKLKRLKY